MIRSQTFKMLAKNSLLFGGLAIAMIAAIPLLAGLLFGARLLILLALVIGIVAVAISPSFRHWLTGDADDSLRYHGIAIPNASLWVHPAHTWANELRTGVANIGVDALGVAAFGTITSVEMPAVGSVVKQGQHLFALTHEGRRLEAKAPISGVVAEINGQVIARPTLVRENPYDAGWIVRLKDTELRSENSRLQSGASVRQWFNAEVDRLTQILAQQSPGPTMADGGVLADDLASHIDDVKWVEISGKFFA
jgi:glycine cleavage system H protein